MGSRVSGLQELWYMGLVASQYMGASWIRDQTRVPCIGRQILNHWTTREFQNMKDNILFFFNIFYLYLIFVSLINMCLSDNYLYLIAT